MKFKSLTDFYKYLMEERKPFCFVTKEPLKPHYFSGKCRWVFAHVLPKGDTFYPEYAYLEENVVLVTPDIHKAYDHGTLDGFKELYEQYGQDFLNLITLEESLNAKYNKEYPEKRMPLRKVSRNFLDWIDEKDNN